MYRVAVVLIIVALVCVSLAQAVPGSDNKVKTPQSPEPVMINDVEYIIKANNNNTDYAIFNMTVRDWGCTVPEDFKVHLLDIKGDTWIYVERVRPDECDGNPEPLNIEINVPFAQEMMEGAHLIYNPLYVSKRTTVSF